MPILKQVHESRLNAKSKLLNQFASDVTSQCGEDGVIEKIFEIIGRRNKWCVEFGAWDVKHFSNVYNLIQNHGWNGVLIEGDRERFKELTQTYAGNVRAHPVCEIVGFDPDSDSLDHILASIPGCPNDIDFVSIDVDGNDYYI